MASLYSFFYTVGVVSAPEPAEALFRQRLDAYFDPYVKPIASEVVEIIEHIVRQEIRPRAEGQSDDPGVPFGEPYRFFHFFCELL